MKNPEKATFACGCFWKVEDTFRSLKKVISTAVGYTGGHWPNPCYLDVCARVTGHAEAVQIEYDPNIISYEQLLEVFWNCHDPTQLNRQGPDRGEQYRSAIFYHTPEQEKLARESKRKLQISGRYDKEIVTQIKQAGEFYLAEEYHQQYLEKKRRQL
ncbi:MAG TPA: peptide-methionine (S)-S-oxide reductase MsrA [Halomicronema sp.]